MREILFRGKYHEKWVYGGTWRNERGQRFITEDNGYRGYDVVPETIGQFTGKTDKTGIKVFEGDIVKTQHDIVLIKWANSGFYPYRNQNGLFTKITNWGSVISGEVIGNIYDNPELLKGG